MNRLPFFGDTSVAVDFVAVEDLKKQLKTEYEERTPLYQDLVKEVLFTLATALEKAKIKVHSLADRETVTKTFESFFDKVVRKEIMTNYFEAVEDIAGVRVICLYRSDLEQLKKLIHASFQVIESDTSRTRTDAPFGYESDHYIVKLSKECKGPRYDDVKNLKCEIQIRTILMDAWASVSHHLDYKQKVDIPQDLRVDFNALTGLFYVADTHFEMFKEGVIKAREDLWTTIQKGGFDLDQKINLDTLTAYLKWKFPERKITRILDSPIVKELIDCGYENFQKLNETMNLVLPMLKEYETRRSNLSKWSPVWAPSGLLRGVLDLTHESYFKRWEKVLANRRLSPATRAMVEKDVSMIREYRSKLL